MRELDITEKQTLTPEQKKFIERSITEHFYKNGTAIEFKSTNIHAILTDIQKLASLYTIKQIEDQYEEDLIRTNIYLNNNPSILDTYKGDAGDRSAKLAHCKTEFDDKLNLLFPMTPTFKLALHLLLTQSGCLLIENIIHEILSTSNIFISEIAKVSEKLNKTITIRTSPTSITCEYIIPYDIYATEIITDSKGKQVYSHIMDGTNPRIEQTFDFKTVFTLTKRGDSFDGTFLSGFYFTTTPEPFRAFPENASNMDVLMERYDVILRELADRFKALPASESKTNCVNMIHPYLADAIVLRRAIHPLPLAPVEAALADLYTLLNNPSVFPKEPSYVRYIDYILAMVQVVKNLQSAECDALPSVKAIARNIPAPSMFFTNPPPFQIEDTVTRSIALVNRVYRLSTKKDIPKFISRKENGIIQLYGDRFLLDQYVRALTTQNGVEMTLVQITEQYWKDTCKRSSHGTVFTFNNIELPHDDINKGTQPYISYNPNTTYSCASMYLLTLIPPQYVTIFQAVINQYSNNMFTDSLLDEKIGYSASNQAKTQFRPIQTFDTYVSKDSTELLCIYTVELSKQIHTYPYTDDRFYTEGVSTDRSQLYYFIFYISPINWFQTFLSENNHIGNVITYLEKYQPEAYCLKICNKIG
jgi:hypothetical protein